MFEQIPPRMKNYLLYFLLISFTINAQNLKDCSECSSEIIRESSIQNLNVPALKLLKNEMYARKGYTFSNEEYARHFKQFSWYKPSANNNTIVFSDIEQKNIAILAQKINEISQPGSKNEPNSKYKTLTQEKIDEIFTHEKKKELGINFSIWKVYDYQDKTGKYYLVLTEDKMNTSKEGNFNNAVKAFNFKIENNVWTKTFETNDSKKDGEDSIWFWTKYIYVEDFDLDGIIEPILFYGTNGLNGYDDGRIKILTYYKGKKIGIRIQNGVLDDERNFSIDADFYNLLKSIQDTVVAQMNKMVENGHSILPYGWQKKMSKKMTFIKE